MLKDVVEVRSLGGYRLYLRFEDGVAGEIDVANLISFDGVFAVLKDERRFAEVQVNPDLGTIRWRGGADLDPDVLYARVKGEPVPDLSTIDTVDLSTRDT
jgi:Protein of unknown function (DUF2442)